MLADLSMLRAMPGAWNQADPGSGLGLNGLSGAVTLAAATPCLKSPYSQAYRGRPEGKEKQQARTDGVRIRVRPQTGRGKENNRKQGRPAEQGNDRADLE